MADTAPDSVTSWLTELDGIDNEWNMTLFIHSSFGKLPMEMLENIIRFVPTFDLPALACTSRLLCELVENKLYRHIVVDGLISRTNWGTFKNVIWPLHRTLVLRPDLVKKIRTFECAVFNEDDTVEVDISNVDLLDQGLHTVAKISVNQIATVGCMVLKRLINVETLSLKLHEGNGTTPWTLTPNALHKLQPGFDRRTAHTLHLPGLQKLKKFYFAGATFHWALAKLPCLQSLTLSRPCIILDDGAPGEVSSSLTQLGICACTDILRTRSGAYWNFGTFLAHFPALTDLKLSIYDSKNDEDFRWLASGGRSYDTLLQRLTPVASHLRSLDLGVYDEKPGDNRANKFLQTVQPASNFKQFTALVDLVVPYQGLLGEPVSPFDPLPPPTWILPNTLESLEVHCPQVSIFDWIARLRKTNDEFPSLAKISLYSQLPYGDEYPEIWIEQREHPVVHTLHNTGISFESTYRKRDWKIKWEHFDDDIAEAAEWLNGLRVEGE
ncbi:hypothetical protein E8E13_004754 [Curvularia kusanoi]|uniref:F-box domain-containing protein n=1 Tax=Curvularia kusanoi TaxID=90978 RepID=A0A9P4WEK9_CURKU|nr:hypothetical protein E8E13_004754 [Curvularia kusanoi]